MFPALLIIFALGMALGLLSRVAPPVAVGVIQNQLFAAAISPFLHSYGSVQLVVKLGQDVCLPTPHRQGRMGCAARNALGWSFICWNRSVQTGVIFSSRSTRDLLERCLKESGAMMWLNTPPLST